MSDRVQREGHLRSLARRRARDKHRGRRTRGLVAVVGTVAWGLAATGPLAAQAPPPDAPWRTLESPHFRITFPASLEPLARRTAGVAEEARERLEAAFLAPPDERIELVLTDHVDASNGFASVAPRPRIVIYARPPVDGRALSHYDDWLDLVVVHELAHVIHLDRTGGLGRLLRGVFGRVPSTWPFFPGLAAPRWVVEGLATWYESALTTAGRVHGSEFPMYVRAAALEGRLESIGAASGETGAWPAGQRPYLYGSLFFEWLLERHGSEGMARFVEAVAGQWVPYRLNAAARTAFGVSFDEEWDAWAADVEARAEAWARTVAARSPGVPAPERLTHGARQALHARVSPDGARLAYARSDGRSDSRIVVTTTEDGGGAGEARSFRTNGAAVFDWLPGGGVVFQQFGYDGPWRIWSDLYVADAGGGVRRVTRRARLDHPSATPDGRRAVAVRTTGGFTDLVVVDLADGRVETVAPGADSVHWAFPAVSPDGRWIAAGRWTPEALFEPVVLDATTGDVVLRLEPGRSVDLGVAWSPDGAAVVFASDRSGVTNLYARPVDPAAGEMGPLRQVTDVATGVAFPSVSPDGRWIHLSLYGAEGWDVARLPWDPERWRDPVAAEPGRGGDRVRDLSGGLRGAGPAVDPLAVEPYRAWKTLRPRYWEPLVLNDVRSGGRSVTGAFVGASTVLSDVVERHRLGVSAAVDVDGGRLDAAAAYTWSGWGNPLASVTASQSWDAGGPFRVSEDRAVFIEERERRASVAVTLLRPRWRRNASLTASVGWIQEDRALLDADDLERSSDLRLTNPSSRLGDLRLSLSTSTARGHALSLSPERGVQLFVQGRLRPQLRLDDGARGVVGSDRSVDEVVGQGRAYASFRGWGWTDHVLALRVAAGRAVGPGADAFWYDVGGAAGSAEGITGLELFGGRGLFFPVRGYDDGDRSGTRAWTVSGEWRFPLWWVRAAPGLVPLYVERIHGAVFADAGNAWGPELPAPGYDNPRRDALASVGAELRIDTDLFFTVPMGLRLGLAAPLVGDGGVRAYLRLGPSF